MAKASGKPFTPDNKEARGGKREGAGRKPEWLKTECQRVFKEGKAIEFLEKVIKGEDVKTIVTMGGDKVEVPADVKERLMAIEMIKDWGFGKTPLPVRATSEEGEEVGGLILLPVQSMGKAGTLSDDRDKPKRK